MEEHGGEHAIARFMAKAHISRADIQDADIIFGVDTTDQSERIFYGKSWLTTLATDYKRLKGTAVRVLRVPIDWDSDEPEILGAMCMTLKGSCDFDQAR